MKCKECNLKGYWLETAPNGETVICFPERHNGKKHVQRFTFEEMKEVFNKKKRAAKV